VWCGVQKINKNVGVVVLVLAWLFAAPTLLLLLFFFFFFY
jgi:hypothetical protein